MKTKKTELERLTEVWYAKLKTAKSEEYPNGFKDIEIYKSFGASDVPRSIKLRAAWENQIVQDYYCMAQHFLNEYEFDSELEKVMWEYHTNGISIRNIVKLLKKARIRKHNRISVWKIVKRLENIMKGLYLAP